VRPKKFEYIIILNSFLLILQLKANPTQPNNMSPSTDAAPAMACMVCEDSTYLVSTNCKEHYICEDCPREAVKVTITNEIGHSVSCGSNGHLFISDNAMRETPSFQSRKSDAELSRSFTLTAIEHSTEPNARMYCHDPGCFIANGRARFLGRQPEHTGRFAICSDCRAVSCQNCKSSLDPTQAHTCDNHGHGGVDSTERWRWQKCPGCGIWITNSVGCNHVDCVMCGTRFCLRCARTHGIVCGSPRPFQPVYDTEGFNQYGYHPRTGLDRDGKPWDQRHGFMFGNEQVYGEEDMCVNDVDGF
jgi:hypothetical protein